MERLMESLRMQSEPNQMSLETCLSHAQFQTKQTLAWAHEDDIITYQIGYNDIFRRKPSYNIKPAQCRHEKPRKDIEQCRSKKDFYEELEPRHGPAICRYVLCIMQTRKHGPGGQICGPNHWLRTDDDGPSRASECISKNLGRERQEDLIDDAKVLIAELDLFHDYLGRY